MASWYYSTTPLRRTLSELVDFELINSGGCRLTVGAANVRTAMMHYFDSRDRCFDVRHVMASGALPPAFPPVLIDNEMYWMAAFCRTRRSRRSLTTIPAAAA